MENAGHRGAPIGTGIELIIGDARGQSGTRNVVFPDSRRANVSVATANASDINSLTIRYANGSSVAFQRDASQHGGVKVTGQGAFPAADAASRDAHSILTSQAWMTAEVASRKFSGQHATQAAGQQFAGSNVRAMAPPLAQRQPAPGTK